jgi:hypothetical protein
MFTLTTSKMAAYLGVSKDFLLKNRGKLFFKDIHYYKPAGLNKLLWNVKEMEKWARGEENSNNPFKEILENL